MPTPGFEVLEHTADAGLTARGATLSETFEQAARGMYALMVDLDSVRETEVRYVETGADSPEDLLVRWLLDLLFLTETERMLFHRFEVEIADGALRAKAHGEPIDEERHALGVAIKAVTRHLLEVAPEDGGFRARVLFDI